MAARAADRGRMRHRAAVGRRGRHLCRREDPRRCDLAAAGPPAAGLRGQVRAVPHYVRALAGALGRAARYGRALEGAHPREPHWYLKAIGIDPAWQGLGLASLLLRSRLNRCDRDGQPAYLEAGTPDGVPLYEHFGFRRIGNLAMPEGAPLMTAMWRPPAT